MLCKRHVQGTFFDSNCVEMRVKAVESFKIISSLCQLKSHVTNYLVPKSQNKYVCNVNAMFKGHFSIVTALRWV